MSQVHRARTNNKYQLQVSSEPHVVGVLDSEFRPPVKPPAASADARHMFDGMPMGESGKNVAMSGGSIDALPDDILEHILGFLPAPEAVRTCVMARRWRNLWKHGTGLRITCIADDVEAMETVKEHQKFGDHLLRLRGHTPLETCYLRFSNFYDDDDALLNRWFWHVVTCRVRMFRLENICLDGFDLEGMPLISQHWMSLDLIGVKKQVM
ncbi:hypothetical protein SETIT_3G053200v2 [Setaria italica]|uniref:F-box domain-containing protein n=2 Tax=Setaria italica TaxID=4555 RepID=A0A368QDR3_SETIT|nr:hypothetical protein SETIT_3G053200v2 [Setaria italica]